MEQLIGRRDIADAVGGKNRYELIANALEQTNACGRLQPGERLPTIRQLAVDLGVSGTTVTAADDLFAARGRTRGQVGRGTFVAESANDGSGQIISSNTSTANMVRAGDVRRGRAGALFAPCRKLTFAQ